MGIAIILFVQQNHKSIKGHWNPMKPIQQIERMLNQRMQFLESLFLISSYNELVNVSTKLLGQKHKSMEKEETEMVSSILSRVRIDQVFKKQFHGVVIKSFIKIEPRANIRKIATGAYKDIIIDYTSFFSELKEKHILDFLKQIFQLQIYNQTTIFYVLLELMFKYLRIKCSSFITDRIEPQLSAASPLNHFTYLMLNEHGKVHESKNKSGQRRRNITSPSSHTNRRIQSSLDKDSKGSDIIQLNSKTISFAGYEEKEGNARPCTRMLRSADGRKNTIHSPRDSSQQSKRRVIKSFKDIREETKEKIERGYQNLTNANRVWVTNSSQAYHRMFTKVYEKQWREYLGLTGMGEEEETENTLRVPEAGFGDRKKAEWCLRNGDKVVVEACTRNDEIRRQMENYAEQHGNRFRK